MMHRRFKLLPKYLFSSLCVSLLFLGLATPRSLIAQRAAIPSSPAPGSIAESTLGDEELSLFVPPTKLEDQSAFQNAVAQHFTSRGTSAGAARDDTTEVTESRTTNSSYDVTISDAILLSLANNPSFAVVKLGPTFAEQEILDAQSVLDTIVGATVSSARSVAPTTSILSGDTVTDTNLSSGLTVEQKLPTGADVTLGVDTSRVENDAGFTNLSPAYRSAAFLAAKQPLLRGTGWGAPTVLIRVARASVDVSRITYEAQVADQVLDVIASYWNEVRARELVELQLRDLELSVRLKRDVKDSVDVGQLAPLTLSEAEAQVALSTEQLIAAQNALLEAGRALRSIAGIDFLVSENSLSDLSPFRATDRPEFVAVSYDEALSVSLALERRAELRAQQSRIKVANLALKVAGNRVLPDLALEGIIGTQGIAGRAQGSSLPSDPDVRVPFLGGRGDAFDSLLDGDYYDYAFGLSLSVPLENRAARAEYNRRRIALVSAQHEMRALTQRITEETLAAVSSLTASVKRVDAARRAVLFSNESLAVQRDKLSAGLATVREVLEVQRDLAQAELKMAEALTDFRISLARVLRSRGELLEHYGISVAS